MLTFLGLLSALLLSAARGEEGDFQMKRSSSSLVL
jgi:hypothetical protein